MNNKTEYMMNQNVSTDFYAQDTQITPDSFDVSNEPVESGIELTPREYDLHANIDRSTIPDGVCLE